MAKIKPKRKGAFAQAVKNVELEAKKAEKIIANKKNSDDIVDIKISEIINPKTHDRVGYSESSIYELSKSMNEVGQLQAIVVRKLQDGTLERIIGFRRILAAKKSGWHSIKAIILDDISDSVAALMMLSENMHREDPNLYDQTVKLIDYVALSLNSNKEELISFLHRLKNFDSNNVNELHEEEKEMRNEIINILEKTAKISITTLVDRLRVLRIDEKLIIAMRENHLQYSQAIELDKLKNLDDFTDIINQVVQNKMTYKEVKELVTSYKKVPTTKASILDDKIITHKKKISISKIKHLDTEKKEKIEAYLQEIINLLNN